MIPIGTVALRFHDKQERAICRREVFGSSAHIAARLQGIASVRRWK
jgi:hypothetical protein